MSITSTEEIIIKNNTAVTLTDKPMAEGKKDLKGLVSVVICSSLGMTNTTPIVTQYSWARSSHMAPSDLKRNWKYTPTLYPAEGAGNI